MNVFDFLEAAQKIDLNYEIPLSLIESREDYLMLQKDQLAHGLRSDGEQIFNVKTGSKKYSPKYAKYKGKDEPIDLRDKGDFYGGIFVKIEGIDSIVVDSADSKSGKLQENYGNEIFTLDDENQNAFNPIAQQNLILGIEKQLSK